MTLPQSLLAEAEAAAEKYSDDLIDIDRATADDVRDWLKRCYLKASRDMFTRLCERSAGEFDDRPIYEMFKERYARGVHQIEGARHQHSLNQAALLKARDEITRTEAQNQRLREMCELEEVKRLRMKCGRMERALNAIASWKEGDVVDSSFDEPGSAALARQAISGAAE